MSQLPRIFGVAFVALFLSACMIAQKEDLDAAPVSVEEQPEPEQPVAVEIESLIPVSDHYQVVRTERGVSIRSDAAATFRSGKADLRPEAESFLREVAEILNEKIPEDKKILIAGHTDSTGSKALNMDLSNRRAANVMEALAELGVDRARMHSQGFGFDEPIADNSTREGQQANRRTEVLILEEKPVPECRCPTL